ncbi:hypothetical protein HMPREF1985_01839 [Mitsuokella sp. oral taxon 131 str. W9106]|nr:hypothetical protein HMPREF1985_01839 [Mitsuokella sp. oral taxon 131 str. W9106]
MCKMIRFLDVQRCVLSSPPKKEVLRAAVGAQGFLERGLLSSGDMPRLFEDDRRLPPCAAMREFHWDAPRVSRSLHSGRLRKASHFLFR